jgi:fructokinase
LSDQVWVAGEVLIDLIPNGNNYLASIGGGPANTARALAKLGIRTQFIDGISNDHYGQMAKNALISDNVLLDYVHFSKKPTCTAKITLSKSGQASYVFVIDGTATFEYSSTWLPNPQQFSPTVLYIGTLAAIIEPGASTLFEWAKNVAKIAPLVFDPNIRPAVLDDKGEYIKKVEKWLEISSLVKVSTEDLIWLYPTNTIDEVVSNCLEKGVELLVVTRGDEGIAAYSKNERVSVDAIKIPVVDTVGAGDTVGAILVEAIVRHGLNRLTGDLLKTTLNRAAKAAAITCSRIGANPPSNEELDQAWG